MSQTQNVEITLVVKGTGGSERRYSFAKTRILIGRAPECDIVLDEATAGKEHARIEVTPEGSARVVDLGTHVGTLLNGNRVERHILIQDGDLIAIGQTTVSVGIKRLAEGLEAKPSKVGASKLEKPTRPVLHVMQLWGNQILSVGQYEKSRKHLLPGIILMGGVLLIQLWFCWNFYFQLKMMYLSQTIPDYTPPLLWAIGVFVAADIAILMLTFDILRRPRSSQQKSVTIGSGKFQDFFVPEESLGATQFDLITTYKGNPALNLENPRVKGRVLIDGQILTIDELLKTSLVKERRLLPLNYRTRARLEVGDSSFLVHLDPHLLGPKSAMVQSLDVPLFASMACSFFVVLLLLLAMMAMPRSQELKGLASVNTRTFKALVVAAKEKKEEKKEEIKEEKQEEEKVEETLPTEAEAAPTNLEQSTKREATKTTAAPMEDKRVVKQQKKSMSTSLSMASRDRKAKSMSAPRSAKSAKNRGVLSALETNKQRAISAEGGVEMVAPHLTDLGDLAVGGGVGSDDAAFTGSGGNGAGDGDLFDMDRYANKGEGGQDGFGNNSGYGPSVDAGGNAIGPGGGRQLQAGYLADLSKGQTDRKLGGPKGFKEKEVAVKLDKGINMTGKLSREIVINRIRQQLGGIRWCYQTVAQKKDVEGKLVVSFIVSADGTVLKAWLESSEIGVPEMEQCVIGKVRAFTFPKPEDGGTVTVKGYPFYFHRQ